MINKSNLLRSFQVNFNESIIRGNGVYLITKRKKYLDTTSGLTGTSILGWGNKSVEVAIKKQLSKIGHIDYKYFNDPNREKFAKLLLSSSEHKLDRFFFVGGSGGEACEASMKLSYQYHLAIGKPKKKWFISREQSYHGSSSDAIAVGDRSNLRIFKNFYPKYRAKVSEHNKFRRMKANENETDYENRCIYELENKIIKIGPENISGFIGETIMGGLVGDVPPTKNYWKKVKALCLKYKIHLIIDEVWCGTGTSGKIYCIDWDKVKPDFIFMGKTLAAGYMPVSGIVTSSEISETILKKMGSIQFSTTHQGHSLGTAAALAIQRIIHNKNFLRSVVEKGEYLRKILSNELGNNEFFKNVRGRGLRNSLEYECKNNHLFGIALTDYAKNRENLLISAKWHRVCFSPAINISNKDLNIFLEKFIRSFNYLSKNWNEKKIFNRIKFRQFF